MVESHIGILGKTSGTIQNTVRMGYWIFAFTPLKVFIVSDHWNNVWATIYVFTDKTAHMSSAVWREKNRQMSIKLAQKWFY